MEFVEKAFGLFRQSFAVCCAHSLRSHTGSLRSIFCQVQEVNCPEGAREATLGCAPAENDFDFISAAAANSARLF